MDVVRYALLGLGPGAVYATSALGLVVMHRGSGVLNFAHGAVGAVAALWFFVLRDDWAWPTPSALGAAMGLAAGGGSAIELVIMRRTVLDPPHARVVAPLGGD